MHKKTKALLQSAVSLLLCISMLIGSTFAWFTDSVTSSGNIITTGKLDLEMYWTDKLDGSNTTWKNVEDAADNTIFNHSNWEPGYTQVRYIKLVNAGNLALKYQLAIEPVGAVGDLADAIRVYSADNGTVVDDYADLASLSSHGVLRDVLNHGVGATVPEGNLQPNGEVIVTLAMSMDTAAGNEYQSKDAGAFTVKALATQYASESDSFGADYDSGAQYDYGSSSSGGGISTTTASVSVVPTLENKVPTGGAAINGTGASAAVPEGVQLNAGTTKLTLSIAPMANSAADVDVDENEVLIPVDVHIEGVAEDNTVPIIISIKEALPVGLNMGNFRLVHVEDGVTNTMTSVTSLEDVVDHNDFYYDPATGDVTIAMATFSEVALVADTVNAWEGNFDYSWYDANATELTIANADQLAAFGDIVSGVTIDGETVQDNFEGKSVTLLADINLGGETNANEGILFYPIGYHAVGGAIATLSDDDAPEFLYFDEDPDYARGSSVNAVAAGDATTWYTYGGSFKGTFDGAGHKICSIYQNTWQLKGNYSGNYWSAAMGLFGYVYGGTVKNLTVDNFSSDGEFTPTGVIAAYAAGDATFENIAITNCNPRVYNTGNGGIIGIAGDTRSVDDDHITLKNITVDNSNKISALWGSWDVACSGLVGMYRGNVDGRGNATGDTISFENCHVAAQIDVYNDVCANYQYYAYRYAGMIIGSVRHNTTNTDGKTIPNMTGISATECTVNYGDWNDYYYCEFEKNTMASYSEDYQFSRVPHSDLNFTDSNGNGVVDANERASVTGCKHTHTAEENHQAIYLPFHQLFTGYSWGVSSIGLEKYSGIVTNLGITEGDQEASVEKFETKFTGDFLYRVGNQNTVSLGSLFKAKDGVTISNSGVVATIEAVDKNSNVSGEFTANTTDWTKGTIQFSGTGVVKVTIQDYNFCTPTTLTLEVVDAVNATSATSATKNNVVLLQDCGFSSLEVSGGYTLYGNGFTMTCGSDSAALDMGYGFVTLNNGTLDNVQIVCPNFDYAALYKSNLTSSDNRSETTDKTRYYNAKSGVMASGSSQILNSRISGARAAVNVSGGNVVIDNSRIELGAVASVLVGAANSLTLRDVTLVQKPTASTYDSNKKLMGFSVLYLCDSEGKAAPTTLKGSFVQQAWVNADDKQYVPSAGQDIVDGVMKETAFIHNINGKDSLNLGFAYMPEDAQKTVAAPDNITDNRTDKATIPYEMKDVKIQIAILSTTVYVYSYKNTNGTADGFTTDNEYAPNTQGNNISVTYADTADGLTTGKSYGTDGWVYELNVDLDKLSGYALDFSKLSMSVNGVAVTDFKVDGNAKPTSPVAVAAGGTTYKLTATVNGKEYTAAYKVTGTETSKESPSLVGTPSYGAGFGVANKYGGDWSAAAPVLDGITVKYWSVADSEYKEFALSSITFANTGKQNGTNNYWEYTHTNNDFTLKLTNTAVIHSSSGTYGMPVAGKDGKLYFTIASSGGFVSTGTTSRSITIAYEFTDNNGGDTLKFSHTWSIPYSKDEQYNYSSFTSDGTLTKLEAGSSSGGGCVTPDTLITLANGTQVRVDSLTGNEELLVWNMETGKLDKAPIMFIDSDPIAKSEIIRLSFSDGTEVKVISEHGFWDYDLNRYVYLDRNAADYIGHTFAKQNGNALKKVELVDVTLGTWYSTAWSPVTADHLCYFVNGMLSMPGGVGGLFNIFDVDAKTMTYDFEAMAKDIETYGLFTYEEMNAIAPLSEEMFYAAGGPYLKISIAKGNLTVDELIYMIQRYSKYI